MFFVSFILGLVCFLMGGLLFIYKRKDFKENSSALKNWLESAKKIDYKHVYKQSVIAIDRQSRKIYLKNSTGKKTYDFSEIRSWRYNISMDKPERAHSRGLAYAIFEVGSLISTSRNNSSKTGLYISVKDIENPEWRIEFPYSKKMKDNKTKKELNKWMEILNQYIGDN